jgi:signal transduction histidine kinase
VIDTALLMVLTERNNRRRLILPLLLLVAGAWLLHGGAALKALLATADETWTLNLHALALLAMSAGLLLMPSALLHGVLRAGNGGFDPGDPADWRYVGLYLPLLLLFPAAQTLWLAPTEALVQRLADWVVPYAIWLIAVNSLAGVRFLVLRDSYAEIRLRLFMRVAGWSLLALASLQIFLLLLAPFAWPQQQPLWLLLALLSPLVTALVIGYFIIRFHFMQLVLGRVFVYGVIVVAAVLFHQVFLQQLWDTLSDRYRVDFAIVEGIILIALILLVKPLRQRSAEALRYLLGSRIDTLRRGTRQFALQLSTRSDQTPQAILDWFCRTGPQALAIGHIRLGVFAMPDDEIQYAGSKQHESGEGDGTQLRTLYQALKRHDLLWCIPADAPNDAIADGLQQLDAALAVVIEHPSISGIVVFGPAAQELHEEQLNALVMVVEQLAITVSNSRLQASRIEAERRAHQNEKLSTLGLIASSVAHEVKNPLASMRTIVTVMQEELGADSPYAQDLRLVIGEIDRLNTTVGRLLRFARPAASGSSAPIDEIIDGILHIMQHLALQQAVTIDNRLPRPLPPVGAGENILREIFFNLIVNAIEAAGSNGRVTVSGRSEDENLIIEICDSGPGIAPEIRAHLFEPFVSAKQHGTGLGLYLVARHLSDIGGAIECRSDPRQGTCFEVRLPLVR